MASRTVWVFAAALACAMPASASSLCDQGPGQKPPDAAARGTEGRGQDGKSAGHKDERRMPWWKAPDTRAELGITDKQSKDIDDIFQATVPALRAAKEELDKLDDPLRNAFMCYLFLATIQELIIQHLDSSILES